MRNDAFRSFGPLSGGANVGVGPTNHEVATAKPPRRRSRIPHYREEILSGWIRSGKPRIFWYPKKAPTPSVPIHTESHPSRLKFARFRTLVSTFLLAGWYVFRHSYRLYLVFCAHVAQGLPYVLSHMSCASYAFSSFPRSFRRPNQTVARRRN